MTLLDTLQPRRSPSITVPQVDAQLYSSSIRGDLQVLIDQHHSQFTNKTHLAQMTSNGFAFIGTTICESEIDVAKLVLSHARTYGAIGKMEPLTLVYNEPSLAVPESRRNFTIARSTLGRAGIHPTLGQPGGHMLYHSFVRYTLPK